MQALIAPIETRVGALQLDVEGLLAHFHRRELAKGDFWLREGQTCRKIAFVERGLLRHYRVYDDLEYTRCASLPGDYTTSMSSFIGRRPADENIEAFEPTVLWELDGEVWRKLCENHAQLQRYWLGVVEYLLVCYDDRVWSLITGNAESRYRYMIERYPEFLLRLPQNFLADMLGIAPRHLSRIRTKLAKGPSTLRL